MAAMLASIILAGAALALTGNAVGSRPGLRLISQRPYNNRYSDASGARDGNFIYISAR